MLEDAVELRADHDHPSPRANEVPRAGGRRGYAARDGMAAAQLCRLAFELAKAADAVTLANMALDGLFEGTQVDAGGICCCPIRWRKIHRFRGGKWPCRTSS